MPGAEPSPEISDLIVSFDPETLQLHSPLPQPFLQQDRTSLDAEP